MPVEQVMGEAPHLLACVGRGGGESGPGGFSGRLGGGFAQQAAGVARLDGAAQGRQIGRAQGESRGAEGVGQLRGDAGHLRGSCRQPRVQRAVPTRGCERPLKLGGLGPGAARGAARLARAVAGYSKCLLPYAEAIIAQYCDSFMSRAAIIIAEAVLCSGNAVPNGGLVGSDWL